MWPFFPYCRSYKRNSHRRNKRTTKARANKGDSNSSFTPPNGDDNKKDNSLLISNNKVTGTIIKFENYHTSSIQPAAGVYCIYCSATGMHYVGESVNLKDRLKEHHTLLLANNADYSKLQTDFNTYGSSQFEFIVHNTSDLMETFGNRFELQAELQALLLDADLCYNTGTNETITPRGVGRWPLAPGICMVFCKSTNTYYMTGSIQTTGVRGKMHSLRAKLRSGIFGNTALQRDWNIYGENNFVFVAFDYGNKYARMNLDSIKILVKETVAGFVARGYRFYNNVNSLATVSISEAMGLPEI